MRPTVWQRSLMRVKTKQLSFTGSHRWMASWGGLLSRRSGLRYIGQMGFPLAALKSATGFINDRISSTAQANNDELSPFGV